MIHIFYSHVGKYAYICTAKSIEIMDNVRISFEVPSIGGFNVNTLTEMARRFVMDVVSPAKDEPTEDEIADAISHVCRFHTDDEMAAELGRRWEHYQQHPETAIPHEKVFETVMSRICAE